MVNRIIVAIYIHPDYYPPTINAIFNLSDICNELIVVTQNNCNSENGYPLNVKFIKIGGLKTLFENEQKSIFKKTFSFLSFTYYLLKNSINSNTDLLILYDPIPLFSYFLFNKLINSKVKISYHNHDLPEMNQLRKYSIGWLSAKYEKKALKKVDYFSLPSIERLLSYKLNKSSPHFILIPNYPSKKIYKNTSQQINKKDEIKILFQGSIGSGHCIEEIIELLNKDICGGKLALVLKGKVRNEFKKKIEELAVEKYVEDKIEWHGITPYFEVQEITKQCQIGLAIFKGEDMMNKTLGSASNKIYEYIACGLPILVFDNLHFRKYLTKYKWAVFTDGTSDSLIKAIDYIIKNYNLLSEQAISDFKNEFYFEKAFDKLIKNIRIK